MRSQEHVQIATRVPCPGNQSPVLVYAVPAEREYTPMEGLHCERVSRPECRTNATDKLTSDASLELVYPPDDGRYVGGGSVYLGMVMVESVLASTDADDPLTLYPAREGPRQPHENGHKDSKRRARPVALNRVGDSDHFAPSHRSVLVSSNLSSPHSSGRYLSTVGI